MPYIYLQPMPCAHVINLSECLLPGPRTELPGPVPGHARVWLRHWSYICNYIVNLATNNNNHALLSDRPWFLLLPVLIVPSAHHALLLSGPKV